MMICNLVIVMAMCVLMMTCNQVVHSNTIPKEIQIKMTICIVNILFVNKSKFTVLHHIPTTGGWAHVARVLW